MSDRYLLPVLAAAATGGAALYLLLGGANVAPALLMVACGGPLTVVLIVQTLVDRERRCGSILPSLLVGATLVPVLVVLLHGAALLALLVLVEPLADGLRDLADELRADPGLVRIMTSGWAYVLVIELALVAPLIEESTKPLGSVLRRPTSGPAAFLFGAAAGAGFAMVENLLYASGWFWSFDGWLPISLMRLSGSALHPLAAGLVSLGIFEARAHGMRRLVRRFAAAVTIHALWNGSIAVAVILFAERAVLGGGLQGTSLAWGIGLAVYLAAFGALLLAMLLSLAWRLGRGEDLGALIAVDSLESREAVAVWGLACTLALVPASVAILLFPRFVGL